MFRITIFELTLPAFLVYTLYSYSGFDDVTRIMYTRLVRGGLTYADIISVYLFSAASSTHTSDMKIIV